MFLDTLVAVKIKEDIYRYGYIGTFNGIVFENEELCNYYMGKSVKDYCKGLYNNILRMQDNFVNLDTLKTAPANSVNIVNEFGEFTLLPTNPISLKEFKSCEDYMKTRLLKVKGFANGSSSVK